MRVFSLFTCIFILFLTTLGWSQNNQKKQLETRRKQLQADIIQINTLLTQQKDDELSIITRVEDLNKKIEVRRELISIIDQQVNIITRQTTHNRAIINQNKVELRSLKTDYANMIRNSYKGHSTQNRIMFILSSQNFWQAFKRLQYMKQYAKYRRKQGLSIQDKNKKIHQLNLVLSKQLLQQQKLKIDNEKTKAQLSDDLQNQKKLIDKIKKQASNYKTLIAQKQKESRQLDREIERLIKKSINEANKANNNKRGKIFKLTPEAKKIASSFVKNKGKLIWPVKRGIISHGFGEYSDPVYPNIKYFNNGVTIDCPLEEEARSVYKGIVTGILQIPGGSKAVQVRHGNYITTYYNLSEIYVHKGEKVVFKEPLGKIFINPITAKTTLKFFLYKDTSKLNPQKWLARK